MIYKHSPDVLAATEKLQVDGESASMRPLLLNKSDWISFLLVVDGVTDERVSVSARVAGQTQAISSTERSRELRLPVFILIVGTALLFGAAGLQTTIYPHYSPPQGGQGVLTAIGQGSGAAIIVGAILLATAFVRIRSNRRLHSDTQDDANA